jgi:hypothetical protein
MAGLGAVAVLVALAGVVASAAHANLVRTRDTAITPHNRDVAIFNEFAGVPAEVSFLAEIKQNLEDEGYRVKLYEDPTETGGAGNTATLKTFASMAGAATIIIDTHGQQFGYVPAKSCNGKSLQREGEEPIDQPKPKADAAEQYHACTLALQPMLQVQWFATPEKKWEAYHSYITNDKIDPSWMSPLFNADTFMAPTKDDTEVTAAGTAKRSTLELTETGIRHYFAHSHVDFVDAIACHSMSVSPGFDARVYFGYKNIACGSQSIADSKALFNRLFGKEGADARNTSQAFAQGGFDPDFQLDGRGNPVVFSPTVKDVTPADGMSVQPGKTVKGSVTFDAEMAPASPQQVVTVQGCNANISNARWTSSTTLSFDLVVGGRSQGKQATLTVAAAQARAGGDGADIALDGNQDPGDTTGEVPNHDDYVSHVTCGQGLGIFLSGPADGFNLQGEVGGAGARLDCTDLGPDQVLTVHWTGTLPDGTQAAGEFDVEPPGGTLGPGGSANGILTLDLFPGGKLDHAAGAGGGQFGTGSGTISTSATGGSIDGAFDDGVKVHGSWKCAASGRSANP